MRTDDFDYDLPPELIAQTPQPRGSSRLLVLHRESGNIEHRHFSDFTSFINSSDTVVLNDTRVNARRLSAIRENGRSAEVLVLRRVGECECEALIKPGRAFRLNSTVCLEIDQDLRIPAIVTGETPEGGRRLRLRSPSERERLFEAGEVPLPPYIHQKLDDEERYQTVFAREPGSAAAPTAGLHFTPDALETVQERGARIARVTLHVGVDTFRPVKVDAAENHVMHGEGYRLLPEDADTINRTTGRIVAVGTTTVRALESAASGPAKVEAGESETKLFIYPGFQFKVVGALLTNFHLPKSTLLMLVSALAGRENVLRAYREAVKEQYRFFSFGDAMLII